MARAYFNKRTGKFEMRFRNGQKVIWNGNTWLNENGTTANIDNSFEQWYHKKGRSIENAWRKQSARVSERTSFMARPRSVRTTSFRAASRTPHSYRPSYHYSHRSYMGYIRIVFAILLIVVLYLLFFAPPLPAGILPILSPTIYIMEFLILVLGLMTFSRISRNGVGSAFAMMVLGIFLALFGVYWWFTSGLAPHQYFFYEFWFGIVMGVLGFFTSVVALLNGNSMVRILR